MRTSFFKCCVLLFTLISAAAIVATPAQAATFWDGSGATDAVLQSQFGDQYMAVTSGAGFSSIGGIAGAVTSSGGADMERREQGPSWMGAFAPGAALLWNRGSGQDITFTFAAPVFGVGAQFQTDYFGPFVARVTLDDGSFFDVGGTSDGNGANSAPFVGARNNIANISSITFHQREGDGFNDFAISDLSLLTQGGAVPEPATWLTMILGMGAIGFAMRRQHGAKVRFAV